MGENRAAKRRKEKGKSDGKGIAQNMKQSFQAFRAGKSPIFNFLLKFLAVLVPFYLVWHLDFFKDQILARWMTLNATLASFILNVFGAESNSAGNVLSGPEVSLQVFEGCDGIEPTMLLIAGIVAFPAPMKHKLKGIAYGSLFILALNLFRIVSLYVIQAVWPAGFEFMHIEFWQVVFILIAILTWLFWIKKSLPAQQIKNEAVSTESNQ